MNTRTRDLVGAALCCVLTLQPARAQDPAQPGARVDASAPTTAAGAEVRFAGAGGLELFGTLVLPEPLPEGGAPALLLLPGSGPTDRDGNQPPRLVTDLLKEIAERLAAEGVATLRFDKRSARRYWDEVLALDLAGQNEFLSYANFVADAAAGLGFLRAAAGVDPARVGILGHSEGGLLALQVAFDAGAAEGGAPPAALVLAGTAGVTLADLLRFQIGRSVAAAPEATQEEFLDELDRALERIVSEASVPDDLLAELRPLFPANAVLLLQSELAVDPAALARSYPGPVLLLHGGGDVQVPARENTERLSDAFAERAPDARCEVLVVPDASHNLKSGAPGFAGPVVPEALDGLVTWVRSALAR